MAVMHRLHPLGLICTGIVVAVLAACQPKPKPDGLGAPRVLSCATRAAGEHAVDVLPGINQCLAGSGDVLACALGLLNPVGGIVLETIACVAKHEGAAARAAADANPFDDRDRHRAARAAELLEKLAQRGWTVAD